MRRELNKKEYFGFKEVVQGAKEEMVQDVFSSVAKKYDLMNDVMSLGLHRVWKEKFVSYVNPMESDEIIDVAGGTGDIARRMLLKGCRKVTVMDLNKDMLLEGQKKCEERFRHKMDWVCANAESLPFEDEAFDCYTISFGIRNVSNIEKALAEAYRVLKPGGRFACLEFSQVSTPVLRRIYDIYSFKIIPKLGGMIAGDEDAYRYLVESIKTFVPAPRFIALLKKAGFKKVWYTKLFFGVVAIHMGYKE